MLHCCRDIGMGSLRFCFWRGLCVQKQFAEWRLLVQMAGRVVHEIVSQFIIHCATLVYSMFTIILQLGFDCGIYQLPKFYKSGVRNYVSSANPCTVVGGADVNFLQLQKTKMQCNMSDCVQVLQVSALLITSGAQPT